MKTIPLTQGYFTKVSEEDYGWLNRYKWFFMKGYAVRNSKDKDRHHIYMHREIIKTPNGLFTDHIDGDKLNNQKNNLRIATKSQNAMNSKIPKNNKTGVKGICKTITETRIRGKLYRNTYWLCQLEVNNKRVFMGKFKNFDDAVKARQNAEIKYFREYRSIVG